MNNYSIFLISFLIASCDSQTNQGTKGPEISSFDSIHSTNIKPDASDFDSDPYGFQKFEEYDLTDTISVDLTGNGNNEKIYFIKDSCKQIIIERQGQGTISIGCNDLRYLDYPELIDWVNLWGVVRDKITWEMLFTETGDLDKDTIIELRQPGIYIADRDAGGGIISLQEDTIRWIHQSD